MADSSFLKRLIVTLLFCTCITIFWRYLSCKLRHLPGPWHTRISHLVYKWTTITGSKMYYIDNLHKTYGPIVRLAPHIISVNDIAGIRQVYAISGGFDKDPWYAAINPFAQPGVFNITNNKAAGQVRRLLAHPFSNSSIHTNWEGVIRERAELTVEQMLAEARTTGTADVLKWWTLMANDVGCNVMFGENLRQLEKGEKTEYIKILEQATMAMSIGYELPLVKAVAERLPFETMFGNFDTFLSYGKRAIANARVGGTKANIFTGIIRKAGEGDDEKLDELTVTVEASNLTVAASDTTAITLTYLTWAVMKAPEVRKQLERELSSLRTDFRNADLEKLPFLNATINESLRLYGPGSAFLPRQVPSSGTIIHGYAIPAGITIGAQAWSIHRKAEYFEDPLRFDPERFVRPQNEEQKLAFTAFGRGSRTCLGLHMAGMELRFAAAMFFGAGARDSRNSFKLAASVTDESMRQEDFFLTPPVAHKCEVVL